MKILYLNPAGAIGGAERVLLELLASLRRLNPEWSLTLIAAADGELVEEAGWLGIKTRVIAFPDTLAAVGDAGAGGPAGAGVGRWRVMGRLSASSPAVARYVRELNRAIAEIEPNVVHSNGFKMHLLGAWSVLPSSRLLWHVHDFIQARPLMRRLLRMHVGRCAMLVANSTSVAEDARAALGLNIPIQTVYNGVDLECFSPRGARFDLDVAAGLAPPPSGTVRVGLVATAARWKGQDLFMRALARLPDDILIRGYVIGGPIYQTGASQFTLEELRAAAARLGIADKVGFTGFVREVPAALRALDIVVHASTSPEPFGLVIAEALASGRAVVTTGLGGAGELIQPGYDAVTYRAGDAEALADQIARLARDVSLRQRLGQAGRATAERRFARDRMCHEFEDIYRRIVADEVPRADAAAART
jgi:glycosyltransferase involved in cell wall biosynthesis